MDINRYNIYYTINRQTKLPWCNDIIITHNLNESIFRRGSKAITYSVEKVTIKLCKANSFFICLFFFYLNRNTTASLKKTIDFG